LSQQNQTKQQIIIYSCTTQINK